MGGRGSGGRRIGSGQKPRGVLLQHPAAAVVPAVATFGPPASLRGRAKTVWLELAPHAFEARTLTPATTAAFVMLCRAVAKERALWRSTWKAGGADHRGLMHRVTTWMKDFSLAPFGKPLADAHPATPVSKWAGVL